ncbi:MAG: hypothetical protein LWW93_12015 [Hyphomicrobiales bacterium]|nr:hypothetical protein [Hyphomicrobiales bacterium]
MRKVPASEAEVFDEFWDRAIARASGEAVSSLASNGSIDATWGRVLARVYGEDAATADPDTPAQASADASVDAAWNRVLARTNPTATIEQRPARWWEPAAVEATDAPVATPPTIEPVAASSAPPPVLPSPTATEAASTAEPVAEEAQATPEATGDEPTMPASVEWFLERCARFRSDRFASMFNR